MQTLKLQIPLKRFFTCSVYNNISNLGNVQTLFGTSVAERALFGSWIDVLILCSYVCGARK